MTLEKAKQIIKDNYEMREKSLCLLLYDECLFSADAFWNLYDAISTVAQTDGKDDSLTVQLTIAYQQFLKEFICHFDPDDVAFMRNFPENHFDYTERLDYAVRAYLENKPEWLDDEMFALQRNTPNI